MSIYATLWIVRFPEHGDLHSGCEWGEVIGQGVPAHIGTPTPRHGYESGDPYAGFLPPAIPVSEDGTGDALRAVVMVREGTEKVGQEYVRPLLVLSGKEYAAMQFGDLHDRICDALRGGQPRLVMEFLDARGSKLIYDDGSATELPTANGRNTD